MEEKAKEVAELLKILANEHRLLCLCALFDGPLSVTEISHFVPNITQSALSQHLSTLKAHGLLTSEKQGLHVYYSIKDYRVIAVLDTLKKHYCS